MQAPAASAPPASAAAPQQAATGLPESAGVAWPSRPHPLHPCAAGKSSVWAQEAAHFNLRQLWGCVHCGSTATRFKGLRDHHSGRSGTGGSHPDPFEAFQCCINNPNLPTPRTLLPEIRQEAESAIRQGLVLPYTLQHQNFHRFYIGPALPPYPPGRVPAGPAVAPPPPPPTTTTTAAPVVSAAGSCNPPVQSVPPAPTPVSAGTGEGPVDPVPDFEPWIPSPGPAPGLDQQPEPENEQLSEDPGDTSEVTLSPESSLPRYPTPPRFLSR